MRRALPNTTDRPYDKLYKEKTYVSHYYKDFSLRHDLFLIQQKLKRLTLPIQIIQRVSSTTTFPSTFGTPN